MKDKNVPKDLLLKFVRSIIVPSCNYGAFIDVDSEPTRKDYENIDDELIGVVRELMNNIPDDD